MSGGSKHPSIPIRLQTRVREAVGGCSVIKNVFVELQPSAMSSMNRAAGRDGSVGAEPLHYLRPDLWEEGINQMIFSHLVLPTKETTVLFSGSFLL